MSLVSAASFALSLVRPPVTQTGRRGRLSPADGGVRSVSVPESESSMAGRLLLRACATTTTTTLRLRSGAVARPLHRAMAAGKSLQPSTFRLYAAGQAPQAAAKAQLSSVMRVEVKPRELS